MSARGPLLVGGPAARLDTWVRWRHLRWSWLAAWMRGDPLLGACVRRPARLRLLACGALGAPAKEHEMSDLPVPPPLEPPPAAEPPRAPLDAAASTAGPSPQVARPRDRMEDSDARILATLVQLSTLLLPCVIAAVAYLIVRFAPRVPLAPVQREFIAFHALQAAVFHGVLWAFIKLPLVTVSLGFLLPIVVVSPVLSVIWALRASQGEWSHYPLLAGLAARSAD